MGSKRALTTSYHPQADGQTKVLNQTLEIVLRAYINFDCNNWSDLLSRIAFAYNNTPHTATGYAPATLLYGFKPNEPLNLLLNHAGHNIPRPPIETTKKETEGFLEEMQGEWTAARDALRRAQITFEKAYNKNHIPISFKIGDQVMINAHSLRIPNVIEGKGAKLTRR